MNDILAVTASSNVETHVFPPLTLADRSCAVSSLSTQALVRVVKGKQDLLFDSHHFNTHQATLIAEGWTVYEDIRDSINPHVAQPDTA